MKTILVTLVGVALFNLPLPTTPLINVKDYGDIEKRQTLEIYDSEVKQELAKVPTTCMDYRDLVKQYDWNVNLMLAIMKAESGCNTDAVGDTWVINGLYAPSCGLFQVRTLKSRPSCEQLKDPKVNVEWAYKIYKGQGLGAWSVYTNGKYKNHL